MFEREFFEGRGCCHEGGYASYKEEELGPLFQGLASSAQSLLRPNCVLDVGCAKGYLVKAFRQLGVSAYGIDVSQYTLGDAPPEVRPFLYRVDLGRDPLPFSNEALDFISCIGTIEYVFDLEHALGELSRVSAPGAHLYLTARWKWNQPTALLHHLHRPKWWVDKLATYGFRYCPELSSSFHRIHTIHHLFQDKTSRAPLTLRAQRFLFRWGGYLTRESIIRLRQNAGTIAYLIFSKEPGG